MICRLATDVLEIACISLARESHLEMQEGEWEEGQSGGLSGSVALVVVVVVAAVVVVVTFIAAKEKEQVVVCSCGISSGSGAGGG